MTSRKPSIREAYVWIWLPGKTEPVVCGKLEAEKNEIFFNYGKSYLNRRRNPDQNVISIFDEELPLKEGIIPPRSGLMMPSCIRDGSPDAWGRRVILNRKMGLNGNNYDTNQLDEVTYLLESGSDRIGALDFQASPREYIPRHSKNSTLAELLESAERVEKGFPLTPELDQALFHGSSIGGARPKALIEKEGEGKYIAKFSSNSDLFSVVKAEFVAMKLAALVGISVAPVKLLRASGKDIILVERFDRIKSNNEWHRKAVVSALTLFGLDDMMARYASYEKLGEIIRHRFENPKQTLRELFARLVFNVLCGNTDDHARNHAAFWDGKMLKLTPAYDICPQGRVGNEATQAMLIYGEKRISQVKVCIDASHIFLLTNKEARSIYEEQRNLIEENWDLVCEEAELSIVDKNLLWKRQFINPFSIENL